MRVYDLAKELGKDSSKEILDILEKHNINLKSSSNVTDEQAAIVKKRSRRPQPGNRSGTIQFTGWR